MTDYERRYSPRGRVAHLRDPNFREEYFLVMVCGLTGLATGWLGTGSQEEYDKAQQIAVCSNCTGALDLAARRREAYAKTLPGLLADARRRYQQGK